MGDVIYDWDNVDRSAKQAVRVDDCYMALVRIDKGHKHASIIRMSHLLERDDGRS